MGIEIVSVVLSFISSTLWLSFTLFMLILILGVVVALTSEEMDFDIVIGGVVLIFIFKQITHKSVNEYNSWKKYNSRVCFFRPVSYIEEQRKKYIE